MAMPRNQRVWRYLVSMHMIFEGSPYKARFVICASSLVECWLGNASDSYLNATKMVRGLCGVRFRSADVLALARLQHVWRYLSRHAHVFGCSNEFFTPGFVLCS